MGKKETYSSQAYLSTVIRENRKNLKISKREYTLWEVKKENQRFIIIIITINKTISSVSVKWTVNLEF